MAWRRLTVFLAAFLAAGGASAQTKLYLHAADSDVSGYKVASVFLGPANTTAVTNTAASGTDIQVTTSAGGATVAWITAPLVSGITLAGTVTCNIYGGESSTSANAAFRCRAYKYSGGSEGAAILTGQMTTELSTSTTTVRNWTGTPTSTAYAAGDRIVFKLFLENCATSGCPTGTMAGSFTVTAGYDGTTDAANAASWIQITETAAFQRVGAPAAETLTTTPSVAVAAGRVGIPAAETLTTTDSVTATRNVSVSVSESNTTGDKVDDFRCVPGGGLIETHTTNDAVAVVYSGLGSDTENLTTTPAVVAVSGRKGSTTENLTTAASVGRTAAFSRAPPAETLTTTPSAAAVAGRKADVSESLSTTDTCAGAICRAAGAIETHTVADSAAVVSSSKIAGAAESLTTTSAVAVVHGFSAGVSELLVMSDSVGVVVCHTLLETLTETDSAAAVRSLHASLAENLTTTAAATASKVHLLGVTETLITSAVVSAVSTGNEAADVNESLVTDAAASAKLDAQSGATETLAVTDGAAGARGQAVSVAESLVTDANVAVEVPAHFNVNIGETLSASDAVATLSPAHRSAAVSETLATSAEVQISVPGQILVDVAENLVTQDAAESSSPGKVGLVESLALSDAVSAFRQLAGVRRRFLVLEAR